LPVARRTALYGTLIALALVFSYLERFIPAPVPVPGIKLGLANLVVVFALYRLRPHAALGISAVRILLGGLLFGGPSAALYSLAGGLASFAAMLLLQKRKAFGVVGVSIGGGVFHNLGQILLAMLVTQTPGLWYYAPLLILSGEVTGLLMGLLAGYALRALSRVSL